MRPRRPQPIGDILSELFARRGYARVQSSAAFTRAWREAAGEAFAAHARPGAVRRGVLEVLVANSAVVQELQFEKRAILQRLARLMPEQRIGDLRFRVGTMEEEPADGQSTRAGGAADAETPK